MPFLLPLPGFEAHATTDLAELQDLCERLINEGLGRERPEADGLYLVLNATIRDEEMLCRAHQHLVKALVTELTQHGVAHTGVVEVVNALEEMLSMGHLLELTPEGWVPHEKHRALVRGWEAPDVAATA